MRPKKELKILIIDKEGDRRIVVNDMKLFKEHIPVTETDPPSYLPDTSHPFFGFPVHENKNL